jgi:hypothetical protein
MAYAVMRPLPRRDELRQRIEVEVMTIAFSVSYFVISILTFVEVVGAVN